MKLFFNLLKESLQHVLIGGYGVHYGVIFTEFLADLNIGVYDFIVKYKFTLA